MKIELHHLDKAIIAEVQSTGIVIAEVQDALDLMADCYYDGTNKIIIRRKNLHPDFFDLKTGFAGEILQKFSTYELQLAIVGDYSDITSNSMKDFMWESNKLGQILFVDSIEKALEKLSR
jgi:hypothetical protein